MEPKLQYRPRNVDWIRAAALLYGDWGTSKAYVTGLAFFFAGYSSFPIIIAVSLLTALVGYNYILVCRNFPEGGGVYSAAKAHGRLLGVVGALLLAANFIVTAALSCNAAMSYFGIQRNWLVTYTIGFLLLIGGLNYFGPRHTGSIAIWLALPMVTIVVTIFGLSLPYLNFQNLTPLPKSFWENWKNFVGVILALSGVEAIANLTGVMKLDEGTSPDHPKVTKTATKAILPVATEVVLGTVLLSWAMLSLPPNNAPDPIQHRDFMLRYLGEQYASLWFGPHLGQLFGYFVGIVVGLLLLSAVNTAIAANIGLFYSLSCDGEMPSEFRRLNRYGVPLWPWIIAILLPIIVVLISGADLEILARFYAIGVVGAITVNVGSCCFNRSLDLRTLERIIMGLTFLVLLAIELTIAKTNNDALFFALCVVGTGLLLRSYSLRKAGLRTVTVPAELAERILPTETHLATPANIESSKSILVAARGLTPVLSFAVEEAKLRQAVLYVLYVHEVAIGFPGMSSVLGPTSWQDDPIAVQIMSSILKLGQKYGIRVIPLYTISDNPALVILDTAATIGADFVILGAPRRQLLIKLLKGNVVNEVARYLPENIQLIIYG